jgi:hypothetical protein
VPPHASTATQRPHEGHGGTCSLFLPMLWRADTNGNGLVELTKLIQH